MTKLLTDPVVLISAGVILFGFVSLLWAVSKLFGKKASEGVEASPYADALSGTGAELRTSDIGIYREPTASAQAPAPASKEVSDRLEDMTKRLAEMQNVLSKQALAAGTANAPAAPAGIGQGFSPETIDKLLKIISNVIQQVDILQKSLHMTKEPPAAAAVSKVAAPATNAPNNP